MTEQVLLDAKALGQRLGLSAKQIVRLNSDEKIPASLKIGKVSRWDVRIIEDWISLGCPNRKTFDATKTRKKVIQEISILLLLYLTRLLFFLITYWPDGSNPMVG